MRNEFANYYYPFGLTMAGVSSKAAGGLQNKSKFNSGSELEDELGVSSYSTFFRRYDAQIGRFNGIDIKSEVTHSLTVFQFGLNNPISFNDPLGDLPVPFSEDENLRDLGNGPVSSSKRHDWSGKDPFGWDNIWLNTFGGFPISVEGTKLTGEAAQILFGALQASYNGTATTLLMFGGADLNLFGNAEISQESLDIINSVTNNLNLTVHAQNLNYWSDDIDQTVQKWSEELVAQNKRLFIYGYSYGGSVALQLSRELNKYYTTVDLLITVDAAFGIFSGSIDRSVSPNVVVNYNIYQRNRSLIFSRGDKNTAINPKTIIHNLDITDKFFYNPRTHRNETINHGNIDQFAIPQVIEWINIYLKNSR